MKDLTATQDLTPWHDVVQAHKAWTHTLKIFFAEDIDHISVVSKALRGSDRVPALCVAKMLNSQQLSLLFPDLVFLASWGHGSIQEVRDLILTLPRHYVLDNIETLAEQYLKDELDKGNAYRRFLELYINLDRDLAIKLAHKAIAIPDQEVKEVGEEFLDKISQ